LFRLHDNGTDLPLLHSFAEDLHLHFGDVSEEGQSKPVHAVVGDGTASSVAQLVMVRVSRILEDVEWVLGALKKVSCQENSKAVCDASCAETLKRLLHTKTASHQSCFLRLHRVVGVLHLLTCTRFTGAISESLLRLLGKAYRIFAEAVKMAARERLVPGSEIQQFVQIVATRLSVSLYGLINFLNGQANEGSREDTKSKINRERSLVPNIVFCVERFEHFVIKLSGSSKVDLARWLKISTARDFRIRLRSPAVDTSTTKLIKS